MHPMCYIFLLKYSAKRKKSLQAENILTTFKHRCFLAQAAMENERGFSARSHGATCEPDTVFSTFSELSQHEFHLKKRSIMCSGRTRDIEMFDARCKVLLEKLQNQFSLTSIIYSFAPFFPQNEIIQQNKVNRAIQTYDRCKPSSHF